ncbi:MAG: DASS family sodium-coupled anion symporter [Ignavibacteriales bacterium]|nr:DASS family sodium-coupled anion symporter [Ignavibacteriales bacterium]
MTAKRIGFVLGLAAFLIVVSLPSFRIFDTAAAEIIAARGVPLSIPHLAVSLQVVFALLLLMVCWWLTEAVPLPATALLPIAVLPLFEVTGLRDNAVYEFTTRNVLLNYASPVIFLFLGGFLLAGAMQKWKLDRRFTLWFLSRGNLANDTRTILLGIMAVTAFLSMWISNTATAAMMLPLGLGILSLLNVKPGSSRFGTALMLGIAWSASIGGMGTIIGSPPNGIAVGILDSTFGNHPEIQHISFVQWMEFGVPYVLLFVPIAWWLILRMNPPEMTAIPNGKGRILQERSTLGSFTRGEQRTIAVFLLAVFLWITNPFWQFLMPEYLVERLRWIDEYSIGISMGILLFLVPVEFRKGIFLLEWRDTHFVEWGTLLLFGGGIALSDAMFRTGLASLIASSVVGLLGSPSTLLLLIAVVILVDFLTEITSNTAVTSMMVPIVISIGMRTGADPLTLAVGTALAASMAFMLPVATPPNALVYGSGYVRLKDMIRTGIVLDIIGWLFTVMVLIVFAHWMFGILSF